MNYDEIKSVDSSAIRTNPNVSIREEMKSVCEYRLIAKSPQYIANIWARITFDMHHRFRASTWWWSLLLRSIYVMSTCCLLTEYYSYQRNQSFYKNSPGLVYLLNTFNDTFWLRVNWATYAISLVWPGSALLSTLTIVLFVYVVRQGIWQNCEFIHFAHILTSSSYLIARAHR